MDVYKARSIFPCWEEKSIVMFPDDWVIVRIWRFGHKQRCITFEIWKKGKLFTIRFHQALYSILAS